MTAGNLSIPRPMEQNGFTLLEVMVSLVVLAVVLVTLFRLHAGTIRLTEAGKTVAVMALLTQYQLSAVTVAKEESVNLSGRFPDDMSEFEWTCISEPAEFTAPVTLSDGQAQRLKKFILEITDTASGRTAVITTWRYVVEDEGD